MAAIAYVVLIGQCKVGDGECVTRLRLQSLDNTRAVRAGAEHIDWPLPAHERNVVRESYRRVSYPDAVISCHRFRVAHRLPDDIHTLARDLKGSGVHVPVPRAEGAGRVRVAALVQSHLPEHDGPVRGPVV